jgi:hypothetical protein
MRRADSVQSPNRLLSGLQDDDSRGELNALDSNSSRRIERSNGNKRGTTNTASRSTSLECYRG